MYHFRLDCKGGLPHEWATIHDDRKVKWEVCKICGKKMRWNKGYRLRMDNVRYIEEHIRSTCQKTGPTRRVYFRIYQPEKLIIKI